MVPVDLFLYKKINLPHFSFSIMLENAKFYFNALRISGICYTKPTINEDALGFAQEKKKL